MYFKPLTSICKITGDANWNCIVPIKNLGTENIR